MDLEKLLQGRSLMSNNREKAHLPEILDLGNLDKTLLIKAGVSLGDIQHFMPFLMSKGLSTDEEAIVRDFWQLVMG